MRQIYYLQYRTALGVWRDHSPDPIEAREGETLASVVHRCGEVVARESGRSRAQRWRLLDVARRQVHTWDMRRAPK